MTQQRRVQAKRTRGDLRKWGVLAAMALVALVGLVLWITGQPGSEPSNQSKGAVQQAPQMPSWVDVQLIDINGKARRGEKLSGKVKNIVIHYVANPGTTAQQNRNYFNNKDTDVSAHFVVGLKGEVIQCVPLDEKSSASNDRNGDTISIEVCHPDKTGKFNSKSYQSVVKLAAWLCDAYKLDEQDVIRHYDITGKECPLYYVNHPDAWEKLKKDIGDAL